MNKMLQSGKLTFFFLFFFTCSLFFCPNLTRPSHSPNLMQWCSKFIHKMKMLIHSWVNVDIAYIAFLRSNALIYMFLCTFGSQVGKSLPCFPDGGCCPDRWPWNSQAHDFVPLSIIFLMKIFVSRFQYCVDIYLWENKLFANDMQLKRCCNVLFFV